VAAVNALLAINIQSGSSIPYTVRYLTTQATGEVASCVAGLGSRRWLSLTVQPHPGSPSHGLRPWSDWPDIAEARESRESHIQAGGVLVKTN
jgi:hypothetical protein